MRYIELQDDRAYYYSEIYSTQPTRKFAIEDKKVLELISLFFDKIEFICASENEDDRNCS